MDGRLIRVADGSCALCARQWPARAGLPSLRPARSALVSLSVTLTAIEDATICSLASTTHYGSAAMLEV